MRLSIRKSRGLCWGPRLSVSMSGHHRNRAANPLRTITTATLCTIRMPLLIVCWWSMT